MRPCLKIGAPQGHASSSALRHKGTQKMSRGAKGTVAQAGTNVQRLNRSILDQGWGMFARMLNYKLAEHGDELVYVDPAYNSQTCAECRVINKASRDRPSEVRMRPLRPRRPRADVNSARNIYQARALA